MFTKTHSPAEGAFVGVMYVLWLLASKMHNLLKKVAIFTTNEMAHKTTLHRGYHIDILEVWRAAIMRTKCKVKKCSIVHQLPEEKLWRSRGGKRSLPAVQLCSECAHLAVKTGRLEKNRGVGHL